MGTVTLSFYLGLPNSGAASLLGSGTFPAAGISRVTFGWDISIVAGDSYFVGLNGTTGVGVDMASAAFFVNSSIPAAPGVTYIPSGFYSDYPGATTDFATNVPLINTSCPGGGSCNNAFAAPILNFQGPLSSVPEPGALTLTLWMTASVALLFALTRHTASRRDLLTGPFFQRGGEVILRGRPPPLSVADDDDSVEFSHAHSPSAQTLVVFGSSLVRAGSFELEPFYFG